MYILLAIIRLMWKEEDIRHFVGMNKETWKLHRHIRFEESLQLFRLYQRFIIHLSYYDSTVTAVLSELISYLMNGLYLPIFSLFLGFIISLTLVNNRECSYRSTG